MKYHDIIPGPRIESCLWRGLIGFTQSGNEPLFYDSIWIFLNYSFKGTTFYIWWTYCSCCDSVSAKKQSHQWEETNLLTDNTRHDSYAQRCKRKQFIICNSTAISFLQHVDDKQTGGWNTIPPPSGEKWENAFVPNFCPFKYFTLAKVAIPQCKNTLLNLKPYILNCT